MTENFTTLELSAMHTALTSYLAKLNDLATYPIDTKIAGEIRATEKSIEKIITLFANKTNELNVTQ
ncbi:hypothetical protein FJO98_15605 [Enterococcus sp. PF-2]|jgi:hypothetical protein|uniref:hypothetical protein n=1 Tax=Enterococcus TaxID=1350 RepID=UPI00076B4811|nr:MULTISPECIES: hypothetical protein [Enterococcus]AMG50611.1 hypothetical protein AL523_13060 [Enterococcus gallinarum]TPE00258.1 hypothetical protein FJP08_16040 [Enterococcus sp. PF-3]TPE23594.1 hypothetical protein FJO98_15605 [Enterococcus sp. PF-2]STP35087.1 Uncharacterised protein [Enterococcus casseliflavus]GEB28445.1 hypothetical protein ECA02_15400 [Enterococcus casseliflavus]